LTIAERAVAIGTRIDRLKGATETALDAKALQARLDELEGLVERLTGPTEFLQLARQRGMHGASDLDSTDPLPGMVRGLLEALEQDPESFTRGNTFKDVASAVDSFIRDCETVARNVWRRFAEEGCASPVKEELLDALESVPGFLSMTTRIRRLSLAVQSKHHLAWPTADELEEFTKDCEDLRSAWTALESGDAIPAEVLAFLRQAAAHAGAPLQALTSEVLSWLQAHDVEDAFRIRAVGDE